jgi:hypothetical protein
MERDLSELTKQLEYYLSDGNLAQDVFFRDLILENAEGFVPIENFLKCNKLRKMNVTNEEVNKAVEASQALENSEDKKSIRRKGNPQVPDLKLGQSLNIVTNKVNKTIDNIKAVESQLNNSDQFIPLIIKIKNVDEVPKTNGKELEEAVEKQLGLKVGFARLGKMDGQILFDHTSVKLDDLEKLLAGKVEFNGQNLECVVSRDKESDFFFKEHGRHVGKIIEKKTGKKMGRPIKNKSANSYKGTVEVLGQVYSSADELKSKLKNIMVRTANGERLGEADGTLMGELLKFHANPEKAKDLSHFTVDKHPMYNETRCFFVVRNDGSQEDFSFHKCVNSLVEAHIKKTAAN